MNAFINYTLNRLREASTWRGLIVLATGLGISMNPDQVAAFTALGMSMAGAAGVLLPDAKKRS